MGTMTTTKATPTTRPTTTGTTTEAETTTPTEPPESGARAAWRRLRRSTRARILATVVVLLGLAAVVSTLALRQILLDRVDDRIESGLTQEVTEFRHFASQATPASAPLAPVAEVRRTFDRFLARDVPDRGEATFTFVGDRPYRSNADLGTSEELLSGVRALGAGDTVRHGDLSTAAGEIRYLAVPVRRDGHTVGTFVVTSALGEEREEVDDIVRVAGAISLGVLIGVSVLVFLIVGRILRPLRALGRTARSIRTDQELTRRIEVSGDDELADLGLAFNAMLDRLEAAFELQREFVSDAGHELRTPITIIRGHLELLAENPGEQREALAVVGDELDRMSRFVEDLLTLAKARRPDFLLLADVDLDLLSEELLEKARAIAPRRWRLERVGVGVVRADRQRLTQAVTNLAQNAADHTEEGDEIVLGSELRDGWARLWVADSGPGIPVADQEGVFERFRRLDARARRPGGAGLGLAIVRQVARAHGGEVTLESEPGHGARFTVSIPVAR